MAHERLTPVGGCSSHRSSLTPASGPLVRWTGRPRQVEQYLWRQTGWSLSILAQAGPTSRDRGVSARCERGGAEGGTVKGCVKEAELRGPADIYAGKAARGKQRQISYIN